MEQTYRVLIADKLPPAAAEIIEREPSLRVDTSIGLSPEELADLETLYRDADIITVHTPLTDETRGMIGAEQFAMMRDGVRIVNCARGGRRASVRRI